MNAVVVLLCLLAAYLVGWAITLPIIKDKPQIEFQCTQSQVIDGKAECVEYRRTEK